MEQLTVVAGLVLSAAVKGALLVGVVALVIVILRLRSAALRHAFWTLVVLAHLALPALAFLVPAVEVELPGWVPSGWLVGASVAAVDTVAVAPRWAPAARAVVAAGAVGATGRGRARAAASVQGVPAVPAPAAVPRSAAVPAYPGAVRVGGSRAVAPQGRAPRASFGTTPVAFAPARDAGTGVPLSLVLLGIWLAGMAVVLVRLGVGTVQVARLAHSGRPVIDSSWLALLHDVADRLDINRPVTLLRGSRLTVPVTWGVVYPIVLLPDDADTWDTERRRHVLVHELAHVTRLDALTQLLGQVATAIFWFDPAVWYAVHRMRVERERACDDLVLRSGTRASDYAAHLLEIARAHRSLRLASSALVSMARPSHLESRLLWVLDAARARGVPSARATGLTVLAGLLVVGPLAAVRPTEAAARQDAASILGARGGTLGSLEALADEAYDAAVDAEEEYDEETGKDGPDRSGDADFPAAVAHARALAQVDTPPDRPDVETLIALREAGVSARYIAEMREAGYDRLSVRELVAMASNGVSARYAREMNAAGWGRLDPGQLVGLAGNGVTPAWLAELRRAGVEPQSPSEAVGMASSGVNAEFIAEMRAAGYAGLSPAELAHMGSNGADAEYVRELAAAGLRDLPARQLATLASLGVSARYIAGLREAGLSGLDARTLAELRSNDVTPAYIREMAGVGLGGLTVRQLLQLRSNDVTAAYVRELAGAGFADLTVEQLVRLRASGVDEELVRSRRSATP